MLLRADPIAGAAGTRFFTRSPIPFAMAARPSARPFTTCGDFAPAVKIAPSISPIAGMTILMNWFPSANRVFRVSWNPPDCMALPMLANRSPMIFPAAPTSVLMIGISALRPFVRAVNPGAIAFSAIPSSGLRASWRLMRSLTSCCPAGDSAASALAYFAAAVAAVVPPAVAAA